ncbi:MAG: alpha-2-macroglobulin family protein [Acuticoccus sp.]
MHFNALRPAGRHFRRPQPPDRRGVSLQIGGVSRYNADQEVREALMAIGSVIKLALVGVALVLGGPANAERVLDRLPGTDLPGFDYRTLRNVPLAACERACLADSGCAAFTYNERANWCFLKSEAGERTPYRGATSAVVRDIQTAPALAMPDVSFLPANYRREAEDLEAKVSQTLRSGQPARPVTLTSATALSDGGATAWLDFAGSLLARQFKTYRERHDAERAAAGAAYLALREARTPIEQGAALARLSQVLERESLFRPAITASAESLTLFDNPAEAERLARLRAQHGFRVLDYDVNTEVASPRMCVQFSETLRGDAASLERFVTLDGAADPAISVVGKQLCVEGLSHGARYTVGLRAGLPATTGETLTAPADFRVFVRDRAPVARFETNDFVLPASAAGVPVTTINTDNLDLALYRVNDRNLAQVVRRGDFKRQLYAYEVGEIAEERGAEVWRGAMPVVSRRNAEVRTLVPVDDMIGTPEPGVYVLTARPVELANQSDALATQWFVVSDIALESYSAGGTVDVFARSLATGAPSSGVAVALLAANEAVLAEGTTDADGRARLVSSAPLRGGEIPALVTAALGDDYAFINLAGAAFELTDRGVAGRTAPGPVDAFLTTERGVYRGGETVHATVLARDEQAAALDLPLTLKLTRPDGVLSRRLVARADNAGGTAVDLPLTTNAATGTWQLTAHVDPEGPAVGSTSFLVEDFVPQRIAVDLAADAESASVGETIPLTVSADYLYGAPASDLMMEGAVVLSQTDTLEGFAGYRFGLAGERMTPQRTPLEGLPRTDAAGKAVVEVPIGEAPDATGPLSARVVVSVREPGGRQVGDALTLPVDTGMALIGIRPGFDGGRVAEGGQATFEVIALDGERQRTATDAEWTLTRIDRDFQWYRRNGRWFYDAVERFEKVGAGALRIDAAQPAAIQSPVGWGSYRLEVSADNGRIASSLTFDAGWVNSAQSAETPDVLEVHLDKERYRAGDTATLRIVPRTAGKAHVTVLTSAVAYSTFIDVPAEGATVDIPVDAAWTPGAYVAASLVAPGAAGAGGPPLPERAVGIAYLDVDTDDLRLSLAIETPEIAEPRTTLAVPVRVSGLAEGERAYLTVAAVDIGILNLTGFEAPDIDAHYLGQRRLGVELRDLYGELIDASGARRGRVRSGGDGVASGTEALPPTEEPVSLFTGLIETDADGVAEASFEIPAFNGALRVMALAWTDTKVGNAATDMTVRDPVVVAGTLPRFLAPGDVTRMRFDLHNVSHAPGDYTLTVAAEGPLTLDATTETLTLARDQRAGIELPVAATAIGTATITATLEGPDDLRLVSDYTLAVRPAAATVSERRLVALSPGEGLTLPGPAAQGFDDDAVLSLSVGAGEIDAAGVLAMLDRFPYGCAEQTVSRALPLLYANDVAEALGLDADKALPERIETAIRNVLANQSSAGGFGLWSPGTDLWLTAYVMDFLTRAREAGYDVPPTAFEAGLDRLQSVLSFIDDISGDRADEIAYASYVLARNGRAAIGDLRYFAEDKLEDFASPLAKAQLAASLAFTGDQPLADRLFRGAVLRAPLDTRDDRTDYGTPLRDAAAIVALAAEARVPATTVSDLATRLTREKDRTERGFSTQEAAWLLLSARALQDDSGVALIDGTERITAPGIRAFDAAAAADGIAVENAGDAPLMVAATVTGTPLRPLPPVSSGLTLRRSYHALDGSEIALSRVAQNERIVVRLTFAKTVNDPMRLMLTDLLPAGFEVENPRLLTAGDTAGVAMVSAGQSPEYTEFRDDRFAAAWTLRSGNANQPITVSYLVRAISPGTFTLPGAEVADMYQPRFVARTEAGSLAVVPTR